MPSPRSSHRVTGLLLVLVTILATFAIAPVAAGAVVTPKPLRVATRSLPAPIAGGAYSTTLKPTGGTPPYRWSIYQGRLPKGLTLSDSGVLSGTPRSSGGAVFTVELDDSTTPVGLAVLQPLALDVGPQRVYVANGNANTVSEYALAPKGNLPPVASIAGPEGPPTANAIAIGPGGEVYVVDTAADAVLVYPAGATDQGPARVLYGPDTQLANPSGLALDARGDLYVTNHDNNTITEYAPGFTDDASPIAVIGGDETALTSVAGITIDAYGQVVVGAGEGYLDVFSPGSDGNIPPRLEIGGASTGIAFATGLASSASDLYVLSRSQAGTSVIDLPTNVGGNVVPKATISGADTRLLNGGGIALDDFGNVYVTNQDATTGASWVTTFAPGASGDAAPAAVLEGNHTGLDAPAGIAVGAPLYVTTTQLPNADVGRPYSQTLGAALGPAPYRWSRFAGVLPAGLRLTRKGVISGIPRKAGVSTFNVEVRDAGQTLSIVTLTIDVDVPPLEYVANSAFTQSSVTAFAPGQSGDVYPTIELQGPDTGLDQPQGIAFDSFGDLWVANYNSTITEYAPIADGDAAPIRTIAGSVTGLVTPSALAFDAFGDLFVANGIGNDVLEFAPGANGNVAPTTTVTGLSNPVALAFDTQSRLWVNSGDTLEAIEVVKGSATAIAIATLGGADTGLDGVKGIAFDADGWLHVSNLNSSTVTLYRPGAVGDALPLESVHVPLAWGVGTDAAGNVTVASNAAPYGITSFARFASQLTFVGGPSTRLAQPTGIAITPQ